MPYFLLTSGADASVLEEACVAPALSALLGGARRPGHALARRAPLAHVLAREAATRLSVEARAAHAHARAGRGRAHGVVHALLVLHAPVEKDLWY